VGVASACIPIQRAAKILIRSAIGGSYLLVAYGSANFSLTIRITNVTVKKKVQPMTY
jgi:hypothetical protein